MEKFWKTLTFLFAQFRVIDLVDIALVSILIFYFIRFIRERRASKLAIGVIFIIGLLILSELLEMMALNLLISNIVQVGIVAILIIFQPELRSVLEDVGGSPFKTIRHAFDHGKNKGNVYLESIKEICEAVTDLSKTRTGALIVIERSTPLGEIIETGTVVDAKIGVSVLKNVFFNKAPLHDGAVVIHNNRLYAAGCFLPLSVRNEEKESEDVKRLGTRHHAALGMSENSDALVIVVSEETGTISLAVEGALHRNLDYTKLMQELIELWGGKK